MFDKDLGIDIGTSNTIIYMKDNGIVLREPTIVAVDVKTNSVVAVGNDAKNMFGRTPGSLVAVKPLKDGVISDLDITAVMLKKFINKIIKPGVFNRIKAVICVPQKATEVEKRALTEAATKAGLAEIVLLEEPLAAAIGSGIDISLPNGHMVVDIGAGTCEAAVTSLGDIVTSTSSNIAGNKIDEYIISYLKHKYKLVIGEGTAEKIKINIGSAYNLEKENFMQIKGRSLFEGLPIVMIEAQVSGLPCVVTDTISSESDISGNVEFVSLIEKNKWGEVINKKLNDSNANRELMSAKLRDSDFDISHEALRLESILTGH